FQEDRVCISYIEHKVPAPPPPPPPRGGGGECGPRTRTPRGAPRGGPPAKMYSRARSLFSAGAPVPCACFPPAPRPPPKPNPQTMTPEAGTIPGRWVVIALLGFGTMATAALWVYSKLELEPFLPLTKALDVEFPGSKPRVKGGTTKRSPPILRVIMEVDFT